MIIRLVLLYLGMTIQVRGLASPMYTYLQGLCPNGLLPLTTSNHVKTCNVTCPSDARCIQGICCVRQPTCIDLSYMYPTSFSCLPRRKQNCPNGSKCVASSRKGMNICCSTKPPKRRSNLSTVDKGVCPGTECWCTHNVNKSSHPVIQHDNRTLTLCKHCNDGTCVSFRGSDVKVCCQSFESLCGAGSAVEMDGLLARDCTQHRCSEGFECSLTNAGSRVCCSYATCSSGAQARAVCAGGCRRNEQCEEIQGQRWCCPQTKSKLTKPSDKKKVSLPDPETLKIPQCSDNKKSNGGCSPMNPFCPFGYSCQPTEDGETFLCCENLPVLITFPSSVTTVAVTTPTTTEPERTTRISRGKNFRTTTSAAPPTCVSGDLPMEMEGTPLMCPEEGAACPKAGYICQRSTQYTELFCCPIDVDEELEKSTETENTRVIETNEIEEELEEMTTTRAPLIKITTRKKTRTKSKVTPTLPAFFILPTTTSSSGTAPTCWIGHRPVRNVINNEFKTCIGFLDISCPFGSTCLPNATPGPMLTPAFICCAKI